MTKASPLSYSIPQRVVHWLTVLLIFFNLLFADMIEELSHTIEDGGTPTPDMIANANIHAYVGIAVLALAILRLVLIAVQGKPAVPEDEPPLAKLAAAAAHGLLYLLLLLMPISGAMAYYFGVEFAGFMHGGPMKLLLWLIIIAHIGAALVHKFYWKTDVMDRMTKGVKEAG